MYPDASASLHVFPFGQSLRPLRLAGCETTVGETSVLLVAAFKTKLEASPVLMDADVHDGIYIESKIIFEDLHAPCFYNALGYCLAFTPSDLYACLATYVGISTRAAHIHDQDSNLRRARV